MDHDLSSNPEGQAAERHESQVRQGSDQVQEQARQAADLVQSGIDQARSNLKQLDQHARQLVRERPVSSVIAALITGFLLGRIASRL
jgi:ElaB/YqjD/DUF883 family membrane-anchored ribosome-binding protein